MTRDVELLAPGTPLQTVIPIMQSKRHSCVVLGQDGVPAGIITERDLAGILERILDEPGLAGEPAAKFMSTPPCTVADDQTLFDALVIARADGVRQLVENAIRKIKQKKPDGIALHKPGKGT